MEKTKSKCYPTIWTKGQKAKTGTAHIERSKSGPFVKKSHVKAKRFNKIPRNKRNKNNEIANAGKKTQADQRNTKNIEKTKSKCYPTIWTKGQKAKTGTAHIERSKSGPFVKKSHVKAKRFNKIPRNKRNKNNEIANAGKKTQADQRNTKNIEKTKSKCYPTIWTKGQKAKTGTAHIERSKSGPFVKKSHVKAKRFNKIPRNKRNKNNETANTGKKTQADQRNTKNIEKTKSKCYPTIWTKGQKAKTGTAHIERSKSGPFVKKSHVKAKSFHKIPRNKRNKNNETANTGKKTQADQRNTKNMEKTKSKCYPTIWTKGQKAKTGTAHIERSKSGPFVKKSHVKAKSFHKIPRNKRNKNNETANTGKKTQADQRNTKNMEKTKSKCYPTIWTKGQKAKTGTAHIERSKSGPFVKKSHVKAKRFNKIPRNKRNKNNEIANAGKKTQADQRNTKNIEKTKSKCYPTIWTKGQKAKTGTAHIERSKSGPFVKKSHVKAKRFNKIPRNKRNKNNETANTGKKTQADQRNTKNIEKTKSKCYPTIWTKGQKAKTGTAHIERSKSGLFC